MDFESIFSNIKETFSSLKEKMTMQFEENKKIFLLVAGLIILIFLCIILLICNLNTSKQKNTSFVTQPLVLTEELQIPQGPEMPESYTISRKTTSSWSDEEAEKWFTVPSRKEIDALSQSNENLINEILGATP